jgi:hypothetical protein
VCDLDQFPERLGETKEMRNPKRTGRLLEQCSQMLDIRTQIRANSVEIEVKAVFSALSGNGAVPAGLLAVSGDRETGGATG